MACTISVWIVHFHVSQLAYLAQRLDAMREGIEHVVRNQA
jgi:hypothetical protein